MRQFWRALDDVDCVWLLGPHPVRRSRSRSSPPCAGAGSCSACARNSRAYIGNRHPGRPVVEAGRPGARGELPAPRAPLRRWSSSARSSRGQYRHAPARCSRSTSRWSARPRSSIRAPTSGPTTASCALLSVGRLETEKNPLLLAEVLALLGERRARLEAADLRRGSPRRASSRRGWPSSASASGPSCSATCRSASSSTGLYRSSHVLLHVSWTEGLPQILLEGFAAATPVVATDVGGVARAVGDAALLVPAGDAGAAADAVRNGRRRPRAAGAPARGRAPLRARAYGRGRDAGWWPSSCAALSG